MRLHVQRFGTFLSNMVLPNIGAFIAWGLITALFIETGWITLIGDKLGYTGGYGFVEDLGGWGDGADAAGIVGPMITYLLPLLIGYTGGRMMYDETSAAVWWVRSRRWARSPAPACRCSWVPWSWARSPAGR